MEYSVTVKGTELPVAVSLKEMKQVRLKVFPSGEIKLSAPIGTPEAWIKEHLRSKTPWMCWTKCPLLKKSSRKRGTLYFRSIHTYSG